jgi:regulatory protein
LNAEILNKAMRLCSQRECCTYDVFTKSISWGCTRVEAQEIVEALVEDKFLDDARYAQLFVVDKMRFNKWGKMKIALMLATKKIDSKIVKSALSEIDEDEYFKILMGELKKKNKTLHGEKFDKKTKLYRFAASRGFETEVINNAIKDILD